MLNRTETSIIIIAVKGMFYLAHAYDVGIFHFSLYMNQVLYKSSVTVYNGQRKLKEYRIEQMKVRMYFFG